MSNAAGAFLVLHARDPEWVPQSLKTFEQHLREAGLIGREIQSAIFSTGPAYLELVTYLGCSPQISLGETEAATVIRFSEPGNSPKFRSGRSIKPRCPECRKSFQLDEKPRRPGEAICCPHCGKSNEAIKLGWRHKAAFGRFFIEISNVFESEAVPGETLLNKLGSATGQAWEYFYWQDN